MSLDLQLQRGRQAAKKPHVIIRRRGVASSRSGARAGATARLAGPPRPVLVIGAAARGAPPQRRRRPLEARRRRLGGRAQGRLNQGRVFRFWCLFFFIFVFPLFFAFSLCRAAAAAGHRFAAALEAGG